MLTPLPSKTRQHGSCPHLDHNDARCCSRLCLGRIDQAFTVCFGDYRACPMHARINEEAAKARRLQAIQPLITVTYNGHTELLHARAS